MTRLRFVQPWCGHREGEAIEPKTAAEQNGWLALWWRGRRVVERAAESPAGDSEAPGAEGEMK